jgi:hypothetical protein
MVAYESSVAERIDAYVAEIARVGSGSRDSLVSIILFGSASTGGYVASLSDLDLVLVLNDHADPAEKERIHRAVEELEARHGFAKPRARGAGIVARVAGRMADRLTSNDRTFFLCTRGDLLSGDPGRILDLRRSQAVFVDRIAMPSILGSGVTLWGEDLLDRVPLPPIRRVDVGKGWFGLISQMVWAIAAYPLVPNATRYAMDILKRSVHSCYFCHHLRAAGIAEEVAYFQTRYGEDPALRRLLALRREYHESFPFVLQSIRAIGRLHLRTAREVRFPLDPRRPDPPGARSRDLRA